jgi:flagellar protein FliS
MTRTIQNDYLKYEVMSADPAKLVRMLYRGAMDAVSAARGHLREGAIRPRSRQINKALQILHELLRSLNREAGGDIGTSLAALYAYMTTRLIEANAAQSDAPLAEVERLLGTLFEAWSPMSTGPVGEAAEGNEYQPVSCS